MSTSPNTDNPAADNPSSGNSASDSPVSGQLGDGTAATPTARSIFHNSGNRYVLLFGSIMLVGLLLLAYIGSPPQSVAIGEPLPRLDLTPLLNTDQPLSNEDVEGKITLLHFWGPWCQWCKVEYPEFDDLAMQFADNTGINVISISCSAGPEYNIESLRQNTQVFMQQFDSTLPTYVDSAAMTRGQIALLLPNGTMGYPTTLLVDQEGKIVKVLEGYAEGDMQQLKTEIQQML